MTAEAQKRAAAEEALRHVEPGMSLGLGTGSTASIFVSLLGAARLDVLCVPTSETTRRQAESLGIRLSTLDDTTNLDLTVDGADEIDGKLRLIKGGGGALLREKIVAAASRRMIVIADASKKVETLGSFPLPVEIVPFGLKSTLRKAEQAVGGRVTLRMRGGCPFVTDNGNHIADCAIGRIEMPEQLASALTAVPGVVEHGLFLGMASLAILGTPEGVMILAPEKETSS